MAETTVLLRVFTQKRPGFDTEASRLLSELREVLGIDTLNSLNIFNRYDVQGIDEAEMIKAIKVIFSEPNTDYIFIESLPDLQGKLLAIESLPGQFDQRADSAEKGLQLLTGRTDSIVVCAKIYEFSADISDADFEKVKRYLINAIESREASMDKPETLSRSWQEAADIITIEGFKDAGNDKLKQWLKEWGLAMSFDDLTFCRNYYKEEEKRDPTMTEIRVLDTYWSDHCRHTTFLSAIDNIVIDEGPYKDILEKALSLYRSDRKNIYGDNPKRPECLMDLALMGMKVLKKAGKLDDLDESEEINACSIESEIEISCSEGQKSKERWLIMFKNETHNHPTEIEPFGGAATCLGGAIRDPLSGRSYVYQAMRISGSGDPRATIAETLPGKLSQRKITTGAAEGFSSYGNQIGLQTGLVREIYHPGYRAKRMEIGAVVGAAKKENVRRERLVSGDLIVLLGGKTGRDGCGGATGSSKAHDQNSLESCGAEVQKGNPPTERALQRLFRDPELSKMIKRCNDFGAGGVSVAIGELADGLEINLDAIPKKYEGLDGTELAISESQERMACVVAKEDAQRFIDMAAKENLEATVVACVTEEKRLRMMHRNKYIVDIDRAFLDTNGVEQHASAQILSFSKGGYFEENKKDRSNSIIEKLKAVLSNINNAGQRGLVERFDSSIGANAVLNPFGGKNLSSPGDAMAAKLPVLGAETDACTIMTYGFDPELSSWSPFHGSVYAISTALARIAAAGGDALKARLTLQEYFERLGDKPERWGKPLAALLGAHWAQIGFETPAIGGKDSMSGSFNDLDVPPSLIAFAICVGDARKVISPEFCSADHVVALLDCERDENDLPKIDLLKENFKQLKNWIHEGKVLSAKVVDGAGWAAATAKMSFGNSIGFTSGENSPLDSAFDPGFASIVIELADGVEINSLSDKLLLLGKTNSEKVLNFAGQKIFISEAYQIWEKPLSNVFLVETKKLGDAPSIAYDKRAKSKTTGSKSAKPRVVIPVFPGSNCEYDSAKAFERAGASAKIQLIQNINPLALKESISALAKEIRNSQILMIPGGFSLGDEPDGSAKFIAAAFRTPEISDAVHDLLQNRDGLVLGICNGFQALIKLGLLPYGEIRNIGENDPTLTYNRIGRHVARYVTTRVCSVHSPWLAALNAGETHSIPVSHGEGCFVASEEFRKQLANAGQIAFQYCDEAGNARMETRYNPNGSDWAIEGILSPDGRILGKMGHSERRGPDVGKNVQGNKDQKIFESGVDYFR